MTDPMDYPSVYADVVAGVTGVDVDVLRCFAEAMVGIEATGDVTLALDQAQLVLAFGQYGDAVIDDQITRHLSSQCECERWRDDITVCPVHGTRKPPAGYRGRHRR